MLTLNLLILKVALLKENENMLIDEGIKKNLRLSYDKKGQYREESEIQKWKLAEIDKVLGYMKKEDRTSLLDLGSGPGKQGRIFKDNGAEVTCIDISKEMIRFCREKGLNGYVMDFYNLVFGDESFDVAWSMNTLLHVPRNSIGGVLKNIKRVLKPNGIFYFGAYGGYNFEGVWEDDFYNPKRFFTFYGDSEIKEIVSEYFDVIEFNTIPIEEREVHYQSLILRKNTI